MADESDNKPAERQLSRTETHDLSMIIKDRTKVLRAHAEEQAAACMADFEKKLATEFQWDSDETWKAAALKAKAEIDKVQKVIEDRCAELGIPKTFAPQIGLAWQGRGENATSQRRAELRRVAKTQIDAMTKAAITKIEKQGLDLRTQVVAMGLLSAEGRLFLESLAPVEDAMRALDFTEIEQRLEKERNLRLEDRNRIRYGGDYA